MRTQKQLEEEFEIIREMWKHDPLTSSMLAAQFRRDHETYDVFGNSCHCKLNDEGEWVESFCPEHWNS